MEVLIPLKILRDKLAISVGGMIGMELFGASDVIGGDTVVAASLHGEIDNSVKKAFSELPI